MHTAVKKFGVSMIKKIDFERICLITNTVKHYKEKNASDHTGTFTKPRGLIL